MCATGVPGAGGPGCGARPLCVPVGGGPPARSPHASLKARSGRSRGTPWSCRHPPAPRPGPPVPSAPSTPVGLGRCEYPCQAPPPPTGTAARPSGPSGLLHTCGDCVLACCSSPPSFRMQFTSGSVLVRISTHCYVTRVFELHAILPGADPDTNAGAASWFCGPSGALRASGGWSASISHVIPLGLFQVLNRDRCYFNVSGRC